MKFRNKQGSLIFLVMLGLFSSFSFAKETPHRPVYLAESAVVVETNAAPRMKVNVLSDDGKTRVFLIRFSANDVLLSGIKSFAKTYQITSATVSAVGAFQSAEYGWYDLSRKKLKMHYLDEQVEVTSLTGNIGVMDGEPIAHFHFSGAKKNAQVVGGHLVKAVVGPGLELVVTATPETIKRKLYHDFSAFGISDD